MYNRSSLLTVTVLCLLSHCYLTAAQVPFPRQCPQVTAPNEFNLDAYMGVWYEYTKYPFVFEFGKRCMQARYASIGNDTVDVLNSSINRLTGSYSSTSGMAKVLGPSQLAVVFNSHQNFETPNYIILGTDYDNYAVVYSCSNLTTYAHTKLLWILTRARKPSAETVAAAMKVLEAHKLSAQYLIDTNQDDCETLNTHITVTQVSNSEEQPSGNASDADKEVSAEVIALDNVATRSSNMIEQA